MSLTYQSYSPFSNNEIININNCHGVTGGRSGKLCLGQRVDRDIAYSAANRSTTSAVANVRSPNLSYRYSKLSPAKARPYRSLSETRSRTRSKSRSQFSEYSSAPSNETPESHTAQVNTIKEVPEVLVWDDRDERDRTCLLIPAKTVKFLSRLSDARNCSFKRTLHSCDRQMDKRSFLADEGNVDKMTSLRTIKVKEMRNDHNDIACSSSRLHSFQKKTKTSAVGELDHHKKKDKKLKKCAEYSKSKTITLHSDSYEVYSDSLEGDLRLHLTGSDTENEDAGEDEIHVLGYSGSSGTDETCDKWSSHENRNSNSGAKQARRKKNAPKVNRSQSRGDSNTKPPKFCRNGKETCNEYQNKERKRREVYTTDNEGERYEVDAFDSEGEPTSKERRKRRSSSGHQKKGSIDRGTKGYEKNGSRLSSKFHVEKCRSRSAESDEFDDPQSSTFCPNDRAIKGYNNSGLGSLPSRFPDEGFAPVRDRLWDLGGRLCTEVEACSNNASSQQYSNNSSYKFHRVENSEPTFNNSASSAGRGRGANNVTIKDSSRKHRSESALKHDRSKTKQIGNKQNLSASRTHSRAGKVKATRSSSQEISPPSPSGTQPKKGPMAASPRTVHDGKKSKTKKMDSSRESNHELHSQTSADAIVPLTPSEICERCNQCKSYPRIGNYIPLDFSHIQQLEKLTEQISERSTQELLKTVTAIIEEKVCCQMMRNVEPKECSRTKSRKACGDRSDFDCRGRQGRTKKAKRDCSESPRKRKCSRQRNRCRRSCSENPVFCCDCCAVICRNQPCCKSNRGSCEIWAPQRWQNSLNKKKMGWWPGRSCTYQPNKGCLRLDQCWNNRNVEKYKTGKNGHESAKSNQFGRSDGDILNLSQETSSGGYRPMTKYNRSDWWAMSGSNPPVSDNSFGSQSSRPLSDTYRRYCGDLTTPCPHEKVCAINELSDNCRSLLAQPIFGPTSNVYEASKSSLNNNRLVSNWSARGEKGPISVDRERSEDMLRDDSSNRCGNSSSRIEGFELVEGIRSPHSTKHGEGITIPQKTMHEEGVRSPRKTMHEEGVRSPRKTMHEEGVRSPRKTVHGEGIRSPRKTKHGEGVMTQHPPSPTSEAVGELEARTKALLAEAKLGHCRKEYASDSKPVFSSGVENSGLFLGFSPIKPPDVNTAYTVALKENRNYQDESCGSKESLYGLCDKQRPEECTSEKHGVCSSSSVFFKKYDSNSAMPVSVLDIGNGSQSIEKKEWNADNIQCRPPSGQMRSRSEPRHSGKRVGGSRTFKSSKSEQDQRSRVEKLGSAHKTGSYTICKGRPSSHREKKKSKKALWKY